jgi:hypothetical protein
MINNGSCKKYGLKMVVKKLKINVVRLYQPYRKIRFTNGNHIKGQIGR